MYKLPVTCVDSHMAGITYDVTWLCILNPVHRSAHISVCRGRVRQAHTEIVIDTHNESGTVCAVRQAGSAVYIRISYELHRELHNIGSRTAGRIR